MAADVPGGLGALGHHGSHQVQAGPSHPGQDKWGLVSGRQDHRGPSPRASCNLSVRSAGPTPENRRKETHALSLRKKNILTKSSKKDNPRTQDEDRRWQCLSPVNHHGAGPPPPTQFWSGEDFCTGDISRCKSLAAPLPCSRLPRIHGDQAPTMSYLSAGKTAIYKTVKAPPSCTLNPRGGRQWVRRWLWVSWHTFSCGCDGQRGPP